MDAWRDPWEIKPGDSIVEQVQEGLTSCECLLLILTPYSVDASAHWVQTEWQSYLSRQLSVGESRTRLIPILLREATIPIILRHIKYIDFRNAAEFEDRFLELYKALNNISDRPPLGMDDVDTVKRKIRLQKYHQAADALAALEEAAARLAGASRIVVPGDNLTYPEAESRDLFRQAFDRLQRISRDRASFSIVALGDLQRTVAMIETMNLDFEEACIDPVDRPKLRAEHRRYLERSLVNPLAERNRSFCKHMSDEFDSI